MNWSHLMLVGLMGFVVFGIFVLPVILEYKLKKAAIEKGLLTDLEDEE